ncbi:MAG: type I glyceraldehyde-3-phosphate dehydrogenase [Zetaproteobacteria bacterium]|nr:type I glyceraldehyde-3-phosphate dehydrogenase [Zetaproteobacteria bacterium]
MATRVAINGFGRIGRAVFRAWLNESTNIDIVHINDLCDSKTIAHLLNYDSVHGSLSPKCKVEGNTLQVGDRQISLSKERNPADLPWGDLKVDIVFECTGFFKSKEDNMAHIKAGAKKVLISAPAKNEDITVVYGVNHTSLTNSHQVISNGSCTTNCLAPFTKVIHDKLEITTGLMTTVHSYTNDQRILDVAHSDLRRARAAAQNMIPTTTGAAKAIGLVLPELQGKIDGLAVRVPTPNVSLVDVCFTTTKSTTVQEVNNMLKEAAASDLKDVLGYTDEPLVSSDFMGSSYSSVIDSTMTKVSSDGRMVKILSWYDNETGFSNRMLDVCSVLEDKL